MRCAYPQLNKERVEYPCGQCTNCKINRRRSWVLRNYLELADHPQGSSFLTLTYDDEHLPENKLLQKDRRDFKLFMKRLRKWSPYKLRYFGCGEYGSTTQRPHYHLICYGLPEMLRDSPEHKKLVQLWGNGHVDCGSVTLHSIQYVAGYTLKAGQPSNWCFVVPPHNLCSRRPGIGHRRIQQLADQIFEKEYDGKSDLYSLRVGGKLLPCDRYMRSVFDENRATEKEKEKWYPSLLQQAELESVKVQEAANKRRLHLAERMKTLENIPTRGPSIL